MLLGDDKKGNRGLENPGEEERRWELLGGLPFGTIDFILKNKKKKLLISRERERERKPRGDSSPPRIDDKKIISTGLTSRRPFTLEVLNFSQQRPISSVSPPPETSTGEEREGGGGGGGRTGLVEQKAKRLGKLSTRRCEPDLWMQIQ